MVSEPCGCMHTSCQTMLFVNYIYGLIYELSHNQTNYSLLILILICFSTVLICFSICFVSGWATWEISNGESIIFWFRTSQALIRHITVCKCHINYGWFALAGWRITAYNQQTTACVSYAPLDPITLEFRVTLSTYVK